VELATPSVTQIVTFGDAASSQKNKDLWVILQDKIFQSASCDKRFERSSCLKQKLTF